MAGYRLPMQGSNANLLCNYTALSKHESVRRKKKHSADGIQELQINKDSLGMTKI
jgi:hypothetical protein